MTDSELSLNEAEVDYLLDSGTATAPTQAGPDAAQPAATMHGDLEQINLSDIFQTLGMTKMEGILLVRNPLEQRRVYFRDGYVRILVPGRIATRRLGQRLVQAGLLTPDALRATLVRQRKEPAPLGELLVAAGLVQQEQVDEIAGMQVAEDLFSLFTWRHGTFEFWKGEVHAPELIAQFDACPEFEINSLLLEIARRSDEWESILAAIGSLEEVPERVDEEALADDLDEVARAILTAADRHATFRNIAEQTTQGLFEVARVARDLVRQGRLQPIDDAALVAVAAWHADGSRAKQALVTLQTLRDRAGTRPLAIQLQAADVLVKADERRLAGNLLLELAQQSTAQEEALLLARRARELAPHEAGTLSFLRTTLLAHLPPDAPELERVTTELLDALVDEDRAATALELLQDARATGTMRPQLLVRESRVYQKLGNHAAAAQSLWELVGHYQAQGDRQRTIDTCTSILRLDRSRKDAQKLLQRLRRSRATALVRAAAACIGSGLLLTMGVSYWQQRHYTEAVQSAAQEVDALLRNGDRTGAQSALLRWTPALGDSESLEDLRRQIEFAEATERAQQQKAHRRSINERLMAAASHLQTGEVAKAFTIYSDLLQDAERRQEIEDVLATRCEALVEEIERTSKSLQNRLPSPPQPGAEQKVLLQVQAELRTICRPGLLLAHAALRELAADGRLPESLPGNLRTRLAQIVGNGAETLDRVRMLQQSYADAMVRLADEQRLDPLFQRASQLEAQHDFAGALQIFRRLVDEVAKDPALREHFRTSIARNEAIVERIGLLTAATQRGDAETAQRQFRNLAQAYPDVPFQQLVQLPCRFETKPAGVEIWRGDELLGITPCMLQLPPDPKLQVELRLGRFATQKLTVNTTEIGSIRRAMVLRPELERRHSGSIDVAPLREGEFHRWLVDRSGVVTALDLREPQARWSYRSGDLSGLLTAPLLLDNHLVFGSLDGDLRALDKVTGKLLWHLPDLPTEVDPVRIGNHLAIATRNQRLVLVDLQAAAVTAQLVAENPMRRLWSHGNRLLALEADSRVIAYEVPKLAIAWQYTLDLRGEIHGSLQGDDFVLGDDRGNLLRLDPAQGTRLWQQREEADALGSLVLTDNDVWLASPARVRRYSLADGTPRSGIAAPGEPWAGAPVRLGDRLLVPGRDGMVHAFDLQTGEALYQIEGSKRNLRLHADGHSLFVGLPDQRQLWFWTLP